MLGSTYLHKVGYTVYLQANTIFRKIPNSLFGRMKAFHILHGGTGNSGGSGNLKSIGNNNRANQVAEQLGFGAEGGMRPAEVLKSQYVGRENVSHFDIMQKTATKEVILQSKTGVLVLTNLFVP